MDDNEGYGLQDICRSIIILKNRYGISNRIIMSAFKGSIGMFYPLPKSDEINYEDYLSWREKEIKDATVKDTEVKDIRNKNKFSF